MEQLRVPGRLHGLRPHHQLASVSVPVGLPGLPLAVGVPVIAGHDPHRTQPPRRTRSDLDRVHKCRVGYGFEFQVQFAVGRRNDVLERADIRRGGPHFADNVEIRQDPLPVGVDIENPGGLPASRRIVLAVQRLGEIEPELVDAGSQWNVVAEGAFPPRLVKPRLARSQDRPVSAIEYRASLEVAVALPNAARAVGVLSILKPGQQANLLGSGGGCRNRQGRLISRTSGNAGTGVMDHGRAGADRQPDRGGEQRLPVAAGCPDRRRRLHQRDCRRIGLLRGRRRHRNFRHRRGSEPVLRDGRAAARTGARIGREVFRCGRGSPRPRSRNNPEGVSAGGAPLPGRSNPASGRTPRDGPAHRQQCCIL